MIRIPFNLDIHNLIDDLRIFSWEAADLLVFYSDLIKNSDDGSEILRNEEINDPVTTADLKVNELIIKRINEKYRDVIGWGILSEESVKISNDNTDLNSEWLWVFDPLDGTKDFLQRTGNYAMHLALNYKNKPYLGVVLIPSKDELWISDSRKVWCESRFGKKKTFSFSNNRFLTVSLGDSENDICMLESTDYSCIVKRKANKISLKKKDNIYFSKSEAPDGWRESLEFVIKMESKNF